MSAPAELLPARVRVAVLLAALAVCAALALTLPVAEQPDEFEHLQAVAWFEEHAWPPPLDADSVWYSPYGTSRVYSGEWSYWWMGRLAAAGARLHPALAAPRALRLYGLAALAATLAPLLFWPAPGLRLDLVAVLLVTVPQFLYVFSYVNGDSWTIAAATLLLRTALALRDGGGTGLWLGFGGALGLALGTKANGRLLVPLALLLVGPGALRGRRLLPPLAAALVALALAAPLRIVYPASQPGAHRAAIGEMRSRRAEPAFDWRAPTAPGFRLRQRGVPLAEVALDGDWWLRSGASLYGLWGRMTARPPLALPLAAAALWIGLAVRNLRELGRGDPRTPLVAGAAAAVGVLVAASLAYSWVHDYQPQGRYLLPALPPLALLICGLEGGGGRGRLLALGTLGALGAASVVFLAAAARGG